MPSNPFKVVSPFKPTGDQPTAIAQLEESIRGGAKHSCLLGATGTGKTFTMANLIERLQKPTLVLSHNKTLAAQLFEEFKELFPNNSVNYFVSYYDYYQPEAYIPQRDIYIEKDAGRNDELDQLRLACDQQHPEPARLDRRVERVVHLRPRLARRLRPEGPDHHRGRHDRSP